MNGRPASSSGRRLRLGLTTVLIAWGSAASAFQETPVSVEAADLIRRDDLVGKLVAVDDRIRFFQNHPRVGYDELYLRRTPLPFRLPESLRPDPPPRNPAVVVQGRLVREGTRLLVDVASLSLQPSDVERFDKAISALSGRDYEQRRHWVQWAARRAKDFGDDQLAGRAKAVEAEALRIEAEAKRVTVDAPKEWLDLAEQGRKRGVAEPDPSALAHRAFRAMLTSASKPADLEALKDRVGRFFPDAPSGPARRELGDWERKYTEDAGSAYRSAPADLRKPLDRKLWADVVQKWLQTRVSQDVETALAAVDEADRLVPDRPQLALALVDQAKSQARANLDSIRLEQVKAVGGLLTGRSKDDGAAIELYRDWLKGRRDRLSATDAEGPIGLARDYEELLRDDETARQLLERSYRIAPGPGPAADALKVRGYRRVGEEWVKGDAGADTQAGPTSSPAAVEQGLRGKTPAEVRSAMGVEPTGRSVVATKGRIMLQWIFDETRQTRYVNFLHVPGSQSPRVVADFYLPH